MTEDRELSACPTDRFAEFLLRHPLLERALPHVWQGRIGTPLVGMLAGAVAREVRTQGLSQIIDGFTDPCMVDENSFDDRFLLAFARTPASREKLVAFVEDLSTLDPRVRKGLLRTWIRMAGLGYAHRRAQKKRDEAADVVRCYPLDAAVTPFGSCNLRCTGCYAAGQLGSPSARFEDLDYVVAELSRFHVAHVLLVGRGEPFFDDASRALLFRTVRRNPHILFSVYTNGTLIQEKDVARLRRCPNLVPLVSLDGLRATNDARRGDGVFERATAAMRKMHDARLLFGFISTVFRANQAEVTGERFVAAMADLGCRFGVYSMFLTGDCCHKPMSLLPAERQRYGEDLRCLQESARIPVLDIDGLENHVGCRAAFGSTVFIDAISGQVAPCIRVPASPPECNLFADRRAGRLADILASPFFQAFRARKFAHQCPAFDL
jgi:sulfatase maturation enzyme AslB (radical SAM superfamily)